MSDLHKYKILINIGLLLLWVSTSYYLEGIQNFFWIMVLVAYAWYYKEIWGDKDTPDNPGCD